MDWFGLGQNRQQKTTQALTTLMTHAYALAARLPHLKMEARNVVSAIYGLHGRRQAGSGETFWQHRPYVQGESVRQIDWRRSARDDRLYVQEREWEAAHALYFWVDRSQSMHFSSRAEVVTKYERAMVLMLALADVLQDAGESVGLLGLLPAQSNRTIIEKIAQTLASNHENLDADIPPKSIIPPRSEAILLTDALCDLNMLSHSLRHLAEQGAHGYLVHIIDPAEENFSYTGQIKLTENETGLELLAGDGENWSRIYQERFASHKLALKSLCDDLRWRYVVHHTDQPASATALHILNMLVRSPTLQSSGSR